MPRLPNRGTTNRAPQTSGAFPSFPNIDAQLSEVDGGKTNAAIQRWNAQLRARLEDNSLNDNNRFREIKTTNDRQDGYLESVWTMEAVAGPVVTGMTLFSSNGRVPNQRVSRITMQADVFQIQTASGNHKQVFSTTADEIKLGDVLTVDLVNARVYIGAGVFADASTAFYVDDLGQLSLKDKLTWDGVTLTVGNAYIDSSGAIVLGELDDVLILTAADATYRIWAGDATAADATFSVTKAGLLYAEGATLIGDITFASTARVLATDNEDFLTWQGDPNINVPGFYAQHETGSGGGFNSVGVGTNAVSAIFLSRANGSFGALSSITTDDVIGAIGFTAYNGATWNTYGTIRSGISNSTSTPFIYIEADTALTLVVTTGKLFFSAAGGPLNSFGGPTYMSDPNANLYRSAAGTIKTDGNFVVAGTLDVTGTISGPGSGLTSLNASNISSGTLNNARLSFSATGSGDVPINGYVSVGGVKLATVA